MKSFFLNIDKIREYGSLRFLIEDKLRKIIPDVGNDNTDSIASKLKSLNTEFNHYERKASMNFRMDVQQLAHAKNPFNSQGELDDFLEYYEVLNNALDRIIGERGYSASEKEDYDDKFKEESIHTADLEASIKTQAKKEQAKKPLNNFSDMSLLHIIALLFALGILSRISKCGNQDPVASTPQVEGESGVAVTVVSASNSEPPKDTSHTANIIKALWGEKSTYIAPNSDFAPGTPGRSWSTSNPVQQKDDEFVADWRSGKYSGFPQPEPGTPGRSFNTYPSGVVTQQSQGGSVPPNGWDTKEVDTGAMTQ